jgi:tetrahydromethanopterin S-methyltransferase subunit G
MNAVKTIEQEVINEIEEMGRMNLGTDEYRTTVDGITKLMDRVNESKKIDLEAQEKEAARMQDAEIKMEQIKQEKKTRIGQTVTTVLGIVIPTLVTAIVSVWGTKYVTSYEEDEGGIPDSTSAGKAHVKNLFGRK